MKVADAATKSQSPNGVADGEEVEVYRSVAIVRLINNLSILIVFINLQHFLFFKRPAADRHAGGINQTGEAADCKGSTAKAETKDPVAILVALGKKTIRIANSFRRPRAGCAFEKPCDGSRGADTVLIKDLSLEPRKSNFSF